jgi:hypothetical protein
MPVPAPGELLIRGLAPVFSNSTRDMAHHPEAAMLAFLAFTPGSAFKALTHIEGLLQRL